MEKFALFRLLDALRASPPAADPPQEAPREGPAGAARRGRGAGRGVSRKSSARRAEQLLARHEAISRRIDRRTKP